MNRRELLKTLPVAVGAGVSAGPVSIAMANETVGKSLIDTLHDEFYQYFNRFDQLLRTRTIRYETNWNRARDYGPPEFGSYRNIDLLQIHNELKSSTNWRMHEPFLYQPDADNNFAYQVRIFGGKSYYVNDTKFEISQLGFIPVPKENITII